MGQRRLSAPSYHPRPGQPEGAGKVLSWLAACAPSWLVTPPDNVPAKDAKLYRTRVSLVALGGAVHLVLLSVYALFGYAELCALNILVLGYYCACLTLGRSGRHHLALVLAVSEALIHLCCFALIVDLNAGYALYFFNTATAAFLGYRASEPLGRYVLFFANIGAVLLVVLTQPFVTPSIHLSGPCLDALFKANAAVSFFGVLFATYYYAMMTDQSEARLELELARSDELLMNILPEAIARRLKEEPGVLADTHPEVSVLFADIVGFTRLSAEISGTELVTMLNELFSAFDLAAERLGLEKIKTIGDAYMVVGGLPEPREDHASAIAEMAKAMLLIVTDYRAKHGGELDLRIGIDSGPVVAGVIGLRKFAYDIWSDTVNTASRMESHGEPGRIHITDRAYALLSARYEAEPRGSIEVKGKGLLETWFLGPERA